MNPVKIKIGVIIKKEDRILLIKEKYLSGSAHKWNMITGSWEETDGEIENAAIREVKEETGLDIKIEKLLQITMVQYPDKTKIQFFFIAEARNDKVCLPSKEDQEKLSESITDYKWFTKAEILQIPDNEFVTSTVAMKLKEHIQKPECMPASTMKYLDSEMVY